jgi:hypothetical protein
MKIRSRGTSAASSLRGAKRRSNPERPRRTGLLRFARNDEDKYVPAMHPHPSFAQNWKDEAASARPFTEAHLKGGPPAQKREAERREAHPTVAASCDAARALRWRARLSALHCGAPLRRSTAALAGTSERSRSAQAALHANKRMRALPAPSFALKQGTLHAGRNAGGDVAQTARERSYELRPQEPHPLRFRDRLEKRPS